MKILYTDELIKKQSLSRYEQLALYQGLDTMSVLEIHSKLHPLLSREQLATYDFEIDLQHALLELESNGCLIDHNARRTLIHDYEAEFKKFSAILHRFCLAAGYYDHYLSQAIDTYAAEVDMAPSSLPTTWDQWLAIPIQRRKELKKLNPTALAAFQKALKQWATPFNPNSPAQKLNLFYDFFGHEANTTYTSIYEPLFNKTRGLTEIKGRKADNTWGPTVDREALEKIITLAGSDDPRDAAYWAAPFAKVCLLLSDITKTLGFLNCKLENGYFRASFGSVTETGRLNSSQNAMGFGCFPPGAEALTKQGWKLLEQIEVGEEVMQWEPDGLMTWAETEPFTTDFEGELLTVNTEQLAYSVTPAHRFATLEYSRNTPGETTALDIATRKSPIKIPVAGSSIQGEIYYPRLLVALLADGCLEYNNYWRIGLKKTRKIKRFIMLCEEAGLQYNEVSAPPGYRRFSLKVPSEWPTCFGPWLLKLNHRCAVEWIYELGEWDGYCRGKSVKFFTARKHWAEWIQTFAAINGFGATMYSQEQSAASWSDTLMWHVNIKPRAFSIIEAKHKETLPYKGKVYCLTVPSSYFLVRQHGRVFVTGNSNAQNVAPKNRHIFIAEPGWKIGAPDLEQAESRTVGAICYRLFGAHTYLDVQEAGDPHTLVCSMVWENEPWPSEFSLDTARKYGRLPPDLIKAAKQIAKKKVYRDFSMRDMAKRLSHGCLTEDHEVLTPEGWVPISEKPPVILAWDRKTDSANWEAPSNWVDKEWEGDLISIEGRQYSMLATTDHRIPVDKRGSHKQIECPSQDLHKYTSHNLPTLAYYVGGSEQITPVQAQLCAATQADAHVYPNGSVRFGFSKRWKIGRLKHLLGNISYKETEYAPRNEVYIHIRAEHVNWPTTKQAGPWMFSWNTKALKEWVQESRLWDATHYDSGTTSQSYNWLYAKDRTHLEWVYLFARLTGQGASFCENKGHDCGRVGFNNYKGARIGQMKISSTPSNNSRVYCPTVPSSGFIVRRNGKIMLSLNSNYFGKPAHMAKQAHIEFELVKHFQDLYFSAFPEIRRWHMWVIEQLQTVGYITTFLGRKRRFFGRPTDEATWREAIAHEPQSVATGDYTNLALLDIVKAQYELREQHGFFLYKTFLQKHDEIGFRYLEEHEDIVLPLITKLMERHITLTSPTGVERDWFIPVEMETGWNLGRKSDSNPDGLAAPFPRTRSVTLGSIYDLVL